MNGGKQCTRSNNCVWPDGHAGVCLNAQGYITGGSNAADKTPTQIPAQAEAKQELTAGQNPTLRARHVHITGTVGNQSLEVVVDLKDLGDEEIEAEANLRGITNCPRDHLESCADEELISEAGSRGIHLHHDDDNYELGETLTATAIQQIKKAVTQGGLSVTYQLREFFWKQHRVEL